MRLPSRSILTAQGGSARGPIANRIVQAREDGVVPYACGWGKKISCAIKVATAVTTCVTGLGPVCVGAIASLGGCCDCLPGPLRRLCP